MKRLCISIALFFILSAGLPSEAETTLNFSTAPGSTSWSISKIACGFEISFDNIVVDWSDPMCSNLIGDEVIIPKMNLTVEGDNQLNMIVASLTSSEDKLYIRDDCIGEVMVAKLAPGTMLNIWKDLIAYSTQASDLSLLSTATPGYSTVIDRLIQEEGQGLEIDFAFSGNCASSLFGLLHGSTSAPLTGVLSGHIAAIPEPATVLSLVLGGFILLKKRRMQLVNRRRP